MDIRLPVRLLGVTIVFRKPPTLVNNHFGDPVNVILRASGGDVPDVSTVTVTVTAGVSTVMFSSILSSFFSTPSSLSSITSNSVLFIASENVTREGDHFGVETGIPRMRLLPVRVSITFIAVAV